MKLDWDCVRRVAAEFAAATIYVFLGCFTWYYVQITNGFILGVVFGGAAFYLVQGFGTISGGYASPCVTIGAMILKKTSWDEGLLYILVQFVGSFVGFLIAYAMLPIQDGYYDYFDSHYCCVQRNNNISLYGLVAVELLASTTYMIIWCITWVDDNENLIIEDPIYIGLGLAAVLISTNVYTGSAVNPFRALPPAVFASWYEDIWIFVGMPFIPAIIVPFAFLLWKTKIDKQELSAD